LLLAVRLVRLEASPEARFGWASLTAVPFSKKSVRPRIVLGLHQAAAPYDAGHTALASNVPEEFTTKSVGLPSASKQFWE
jgi:hypothetical protein